MVKPPSGSHTDAENLTVTLVFPTVVKPVAGVHRGVFSDADFLRLVSPQEMKIYSLSESRRCRQPLRRFVLASGDEDGNGYWEMAAKIELRCNYNSRMARSPSSTDLSCCALILSILRRNRSLATARI